MATKKTVGAGKGTPPAEGIGAASKAAGKTPVTNTPVKKAPVKKALAEKAPAKNAPAKKSISGRRPPQPERPLSVVSVGGFAVVSRGRVMTPTDLEKLRRAIALLAELAVVSCCERPSD